MTPDREVFREAFESRLSSIGCSMKRGCRWLSQVAFAAVFFTADAKGQMVDRTLSSLAGGSAGGLAGIIAALPASCGGVFSNKECKPPAAVIGFALGNVVGSTFGAAAGGPSSCNRPERMGRAFVGTLGGAGLGLAAVSRAHGNLRIGLSPLVQLGQAVGAAAMLAPCKALGATSRDSAVDRFVSECDAHSHALARDAAGVAMVGGYAALHAYFNHEWWSANPAKHWFVQNDWDKDERDADKFGHFLGGYQLSRVTSELLRAGCVAPSRAAVIGALYAWMFQFQIEEWDGTQQLYGFNPSDLIADAAGGLFAVAQQRTRALSYVKPILSYRPTQAYRRRNEPGHYGQPRGTTDYSGQTYWFSTDLNGLLPDRYKSFWPGFVRLSPGYSITDYVLPDGSGRRARRKILLSLDLDPEKLPGGNKVWRTVKHELSFLRVPGPTLQFTPKTRIFGGYY